MNPFLITEPTVISFSGGRTSAYMLWRVLQAHEGKLSDDAFVVFCNTGAENEETLRFVDACAKNWDVKIHWLEFVPKKEFKEVSFETASRNHEPFEALIRQRKFLPNSVMRFCTSELKILTIERFMAANGYKADEFQTMVGIRKDEERRVAKLRENKLTPLVKDNITQQDVQAFWNSNEFNLGLSFQGGITPLGNCELCFMKGAKQLASLIENKPERAIWWAKMEKEIGGTFSKDKPSYQAFLDNTVNQATLFDTEGSPCFCGD